MDRGIAWHLGEWERGQEICRHKQRRLSGTEVGSDILNQAKVTPVTTSNHVWTYYILLCSNSNAQSCTAERGSSLDPSVLYNGLLFRFVFPYQVKSNQLRHFWHMSAVIDKSSDHRRVSSGCHFVQSIFLPPIGCVQSDSKPYQNSDNILIVLQA